jgi:acyl-CoA dehydrogenase
MIYGDEGGATGWLIGEENRGLNCMFTMMNNARLLVGMQGVALAQRATQAAFDFARERKQGRVAGSLQSSTIINHPDVKRMLLEMRAKTAAARMLCMATAAAIDERDVPTGSLLTPMAKSYATDIAVEVTSAAIQVHGGMGFIEETGIAQYYRDARILPIYEGTNGIQAIDLVTRKLAIENGETLEKVLQLGQASMAFIAGEAATAEMGARIRLLSQRLSKEPNSQSSLAAATAFMRALAAFVAAGHLATAAKVVPATELKDEANTDAQYFIATELPSALAAAEAAMAGAEVISNTKLE